MNEEDVDDVAVIVDTLIDTLSKLPDEILKKKNCSTLIYNGVLNLLKRVCDILNITKDDLIEHIERVWSGGSQWN